MKTMQSESPRRLDRTWIEGFVHDRNGVGELHTLDCIRGKGAEKVWPLKFG